MSTCILHRLHNEHVTWLFVCVVIHCCCAAVSVQLLSPHNSTSLTKGLSQYHILTFITVILVIKIHRVLLQHLLLDLLQ